LERDDELDESGLIEVRVLISKAENAKLLAIRSALKRVIAKKAIARLLIAYGVENSAAILAWYGERAAVESGKIREDGEQADETG
jgi:hypothetical protein